MKNLKNSISWLAKACNASYDLNSADVIANPGHILLLKEQGFIIGFNSCDSDFPVDASLTEKGLIEVMSLRSRQ